MSEHSQPHQCPVFHSSYLSEKEQEEGLKKEEEGKKEKYHLFMFIIHHSQCLAQSHSIVFNLHINILR